MEGQINDVDGYVSETEDLISILKEERQQLDAVKGRRKWNFR